MSSTFHGTDTQLQLPDTSGSQQLWLLDQLELFVVLVGAFTSLILVMNCSILQLSHTLAHSSCTLRRSTEASISSTAMACVDRRDASGSSQEPSFLRPYVARGKYRAIDAVGIETFSIKYLTQHGRVGIVC